MDLNLTDRQKELQTAMRDFCKKEIAPAAEQMDRRDLMAHEHFKKMGEAGLMGLTIPEGFGGQGADLISHVLCMEELAAACTSTALAVHAGGFAAALPILLYGNEEQKRKLLPGLASGDKVGCFALSEAQSGSDIASLSATAAKSNGGYSLTGEKAYVVNGPVADLAVVFARTGQGDVGISAFAIEKGTAGLLSGERANLTCARGASVCSLKLTDCEPGPDGLIGAEGQGLEIANECLEHTRLSMAAIALGITRAALDASIARAESRWQFGKLIGAFQEVNNKISWMRANLEVGRQLALYAAWRKGRGEACAAEISMAKLLASEIAVKSAGDTVQIFGGAGLTAGCIAERLHRDAKMCEIAEGTSEMQRQLIAAETLAG